MDEIEPLDSTLQQAVTLKKWQKKINLHDNQFYQMVLDEVQATLQDNLLNLFDMREPKEINYLNFSPIVEE